MYLTRFFLALVGAQGLIFPNITISNVDVSQKNIQEATTLITQKVNPPKELNLIYNSEAFTLETKDIDLNYKYLESAQRAYQIDKTGNLLADFVTKVKLLIHPINLGMVATYDAEKLSKFISVVDSQITDDPVYPTINAKGDKITIVNGKPGMIADRESLYTLIVENIAHGTQNDIQIPVIEVDPQLSEQEIAVAQKRAEKLVGKSITIRFDPPPGKQNTIVKKDTEIIKLLDPAGGYHEKEIQNLVNEIALQANRESQNPKFVFENNKVTEFQPALDGVKVNETELKYLIENGIENDNLTFDLPVTKTPPTISTEKVNNLGIKELIGQGTSTYYHSIPGRVHNVALASNKINGTLVAPGETFSFNEVLGDVSKFTGYQSAYVILSGKTVLGDGGGVCQVSSTLFRAVLNAGLPIDQRTAHAYRVGYYEQGSSPGFDATVYSPSPDFKFTNDTGNYILITAKADSKNYSLVFEIYGTSDGRVAQISKPVVSNQIAPGPDVYQDDPTLPAGTVKQVEYRAYGSRVSFNYLVTRNGEELFKKTFVSNYKPWSAVYLRGTRI